MLDYHWSHMEMSTLPVSVLAHIQNEGLALANEPSALCVCSRQERILPWWGFSRSKSKFGSCLCITTNFYAMVEVNKRTPSKSFIAE